MISIEETKKVAELAKLEFDEKGLEKFENTKGILENAKTIGNMINVPSINNNEEE